MKNSGGSSMHGHNKILHVVSMGGDDGSITEIIENNHSSREMTSKMACSIKASPKGLLSSIKTPSNEASQLRPPADHTTITSYSKSKPK